MIKSFENGILIGEIVNVSADERVITDTFLDGQFELNNERFYA